MIIAGHPVHERRFTRRSFLKACGIASAATLSATVLGACSQSPRAGSAEEQASSLDQSSDQESGAPLVEPVPEKAGAASATGNALIAVFSWSGNTLAMAERINQDVPNSTLFGIQPATPYPDDYNTVVDLAQEELKSGTIPALAEDIEDFSGYDTVFIGYPLWWYHIPQVVKGFLDGHDFTGKTVIPFDTHGGGGWSQSLDDVRAATEGATMLDGLALSGSTIESHLDEVDAWVASLPLG